MSRKQDYGKLAHQLLSTRLLVPFSRLRRMVRAAQRPTMLAYYRGLAFRRKGLGWSEEQKRSWMLSALRETVRRAGEETAYYRRLFQRIGFDPRADFSYADFARLPVLTREDIHASEEELISAAVPKKQLKPDATGGSSGIPTPVWLGPQERGWSESAIHFFMDRLGVPAGTSVAFLWGHHLDPMRRDTWRERYQAFEINARWFDCFRLSAEMLEHYHQQFELWRPACIIAYATALGHLAEYILERGYRPNYPTRCFITGAEKLLAQHRAAVQAAFGRPVYERYGARDTGCIGHQMRSDSLDYEVDWANMFLEPESEGPEADILVTKLHADGMPMLRYRLNDVGRFPSECKPGFPALTLHEVIGRATDRVWLPDGRWINGIEFPHLLKDYPVREFVFVQHEDYSAELRLVAKAGFGESDRRAILDTLRQNLPGIPLEVQVVAEIPRTQANKWRPVISEIKPACTTSHL